MKKTIKLEILPMSKVDFLKGQKVPEGTTIDDYSYVSIKIGSKKPSMTLIGANYEEISESELTALLFQIIAESLYKKHHDDDKLIVDGKEVELSQTIQ